VSRLPVFDPQSAPVLTTDAQLRAVAADRLDADALRQRFGSALAWEPEFTGDGRVLERTTSAAAVLIPLVVRDDGLHLLLTRRTDHLRDHAGQISFPGGRGEAHDADAVATALRETEEEVGLPRSHVEVIGTLPTYTTITAFVVTPVVALVRPGFTLAPDPFEVAEAFEVPLAFLMDPAHHEHRQLEIGGTRRSFVAMPWQGRGADGIDRRYFIWGATAAMLRNFYRFLQA
jgi:8-oxo-dGTP pyrophosphatase MutT (NUDIX family)